MYRGKSSPRDVQGGGGEMGGGQSGNVGGGGLPRTYRSAAWSIPEREGHLGWWVMPEGLVPVVFPLFPAFSAPRSWLPGVVAATFELHVVPSKDRDPVVRSRSQGQE